MQASDDEKNIVQSGQILLKGVSRTRYLFKNTDKYRALKALSARR